MWLLHISYTLRNVRIWHQSNGLTFRIKAHNTHIIMRCASRCCCSCHDRWATYCSRHQLTSFIIWQIGNDLEWVHFQHCGRQQTQVKFWSTNNLHTFSFTSAVNYLCLPYLWFPLGLLVISLLAFSFTWIGLIITCPLPKLPAISVTWQLTLTLPAFSAPSVNRLDRLTCFYRLQVHSRYWNLKMSCLDCIGLPRRRQLIMLSSSAKRSRRRCINFMYYSHNGRSRSYHF